VSTWGTPVLLLVFAAAGVATWIAGIYLSKATDVLDNRFNLGDAVGGMLLLGLAGSLPELAITASAALSGHLSLAVGNRLGGIAMPLILVAAVAGLMRRADDCASVRLSEQCIRLIPRHAKSFQARQEMGKSLVGRSRSRERKSPVSGAFRVAGAGLNLRPPGYEPLPFRSN
jgi:hypothetical protein